ncbi:hypothetical protein BG006_005245 [Podila minutissima]|uniref:Uncharacterized protein n=1 Tax=Podila minutissima TaxID=64525 RepID=A0A9P5SKN3_9FUNG|nr:hypothetical protein BG006_005245 [Podila minutissima]
MFDGNAEYQSVNDKINKFHSLGLTHKLSIPQMAIIGDQSSGKSSVLEAITKLSFPRDKEMCTRFATRVNMRRNSALTEDMLSARIEGEDAFNARHKVVESPMTFQGVIKDAMSVICNNSQISDKVLELTLSGPAQFPLTLIDLPGFISTTSDGQDKTLPDTISSINLRYITDPRTVILAVVNASVDLNTSRALREAAVHDPEGERTIPIVTKPDRIESGLISDWIEVILNKRKTMKLGYLVMRNMSYEQNTLSWEDSCVEEDKFFASDLWNAVSTDRKGRKSVKRFLGNLLYEHVSRELPALKREVDAALDTYKRDLKEMGAPIADTNEARENLTLATLKLQPRVIGFLNADYDHDYIAAFKKKPIPSDSQDFYFARSSLLKLYSEYHSAMSSGCNHPSTSEIVLQVARYKGNDLPGFVSFTTFKNIVNGHYLDGWRSLTKEHVRQMHRYLSDALTSYIAHIADATARDVFTHVFDRFSRNQLTKIEETISDIFEDESTPFTLSRHYTDIIEERSRNVQIPALTRESSVIDMIKGSEAPPSFFSTQESSQNGTPSPSSPGPSPNGDSAHAPLQNGDPVDSQLKNSDSAPPPLSQPRNNNSAPSSQQQWINSDWNDRRTTDEMFPCLQAYLKTARERIVDKVLMETIERHMIKKISEYFVMLYKVSSGELQCMLESPALKNRRQDLETKIKDFENILNEL